MASYGFGRRWGGRRRRRDDIGWLLMPAIIVVGGLGGATINAFPDFSLSRLLLDGPAVASSGAFALCGGGARVTCVVDGDTFWLEGTKIRMADINTPEVSKPMCDGEAALGRQASVRLAALLNEGPFELAPADRDEDRYGRKLRVVERDGRSIGDVLVAEGLAHHWRGYQESWC